MKSPALIFERLPEKVFQKPKQNFLKVRAGVRVAKRKVKLKRSRKLSARNCQKVQPIEVAEFVQKVMSAVAANVRALRCFLFAGLIATSCPIAQK